MPGKGKKGCQPPPEEDARAYTSPAPHVAPVWTVMPPPTLPVFSGGDGVKTFIAEARRVLQALRMGEGMSADFVIRHLEGPAKIEVISREPETPEEVFHILQEVFGDCRPLQSPPGFPYPATGALRGDTGVQSLVAGSGSKDQAPPACPSGCCTDPGSVRRRPPTPISLTRHGEICEGSRVLRFPGGEGGGDALDEARWRPFPAQKVGMVLDFAENFACQYQDEIQAAHWHHAQATVHPIVAYYACPTCGDCMTVSLVFLSDDKTHDFNAVHAFTTLAVQHLHAARGLPVEAVVQWTDGCASQYKSKGPFSDISCAIQDHSCTLEHHYFGSRHGKGPSDGESAVVKHHASMAMKTLRAVIKSAKDLFEYCVASALNKQPPEEDDPDCQHPPGEEPKSQHFLRTFFFVKSEDIDRHRNRDVKTVKGTRSLHAVRCLEPNVIQTRELTCFCDACRTGMGDCNNTEVVGKWQEQTLKQPGQRAVQPVPQHQQPAPQPPQQQQPVPQPAPQQQQPVPQPGPQQQQPGPQQQHPVPQPGPQQQQQPGPQCSATTACATTACAATASGSRNLGPSELQRAQPHCSLL